MKIKQILGALLLLLVSVQVNAAVIEGSFTGTIFNSTTGFVQSIL